MQCFSTIAANIPGQFVGTAPKASFFLFRSEDAATEYPIEEHNWVCAAERADSSGSNIISSSLGYNTFDGAFNNATYNHTYSQMNGNITMPAIGADLAAKKGIIVLNSAGNEGNNSWKFIITPADADSIIAVGAVNSAGQVANFSSYGPSSDGQVKPDVVSVGVATVVQGTSNNIATSNGTSFSCPNMAGLVTCLWQGFPEFNNMKIITTLRQVSSNVSTPNDRIGYGIPDMRKAVMLLTKELATSNASITSCKTTINWTSKDVSSMKYEIERKLPNETSYTKIGERLGTGNVFGNRSYQYSDSLINVAAGTISYRIRQIIDTSATGLTADYIDTVTVSLANACTATPTTSNTELIKVSPNPSNNIFNVQLLMQEATPNITVSLFNAEGQLVLRSIENKPAGAYIFSLKTSHLASGKYILTLHNSQGLIATKELLKL
jgi:serine protease AprX